MPEETAQNRTEQATPRKREQARRRGQVVFSAELNSGVVMLVASLLLWLSGSYTGPMLLETMNRWLLTIGMSTSWGPAEIQKSLTVLAADCLQLTGGLLAVVFVFGLLCGLVQAGFNFSLEPLNPDWSKLSLVKGWNRVFSMRSIFRAIFVTMKVVAIAGLVGWLLSAKIGPVLSSSMLTFGAAVVTGWEITVHTMLATAAALVLIGGMDYLFQRWKHEQDLMMSKQEQKEELKEEVGDPQLRARIKKLQREFLEQAQMRDVPRATAVITNPTHLSIAVRYEQGETEAPIVLAKGAGAVALRIRKIAAEHDIPIIERKPLAQALFAMTDVGDEIPVELYQAVAEILIYVYSLRRAA